MGTDNVHLIRIGGTNLGAVHLLALPIDRLFHIEFADTQIFLRLKIAIDTGTVTVTVDRGTPGSIAVAADGAAGGGG